MNGEFNRDLLFGILAVQMGLISREQLVAAARRWMVNKDRSIEAVLQEDGAINESDLVLFAPLVARHIENHGGDPERSLAALSSIGSLRDELRSLGDVHIEATIAMVSHNGEQSEGPFDSATGSSVNTQDTRYPTGSRFRILRPHAKGGLGEVSVARDEELNREVALKEIQSR